MKADKNPFTERLETYRKTLQTETPSKSKITARGEIVDEIFELALGQGSKLKRKDFFILLAPYKEDDLRYIKSTCVDKVRQGFSVEKYIKWLRKK